MRNTLIRVQNTTLRVWFRLDPIQAFLLTTWDDSNNIYHSTILYATIHDSTMMEGIHIYHNYLGVVELPMELPDTFASLIASFHQSVCLEFQPFVSE